MAGGPLAGLRMGPDGHDPLKGPGGMRGPRGGGMGMGVGMDGPHGHHSHHHRDGSGGSGPRGNARDGRQSSYDGRSGGPRSGDRDRDRRGDREHHGREHHGGRDRDHGRDHGRDHRDHRDHRDRDRHHGERERGAHGPHSGGGGGVDAEHEGMAAIAQKYASLDDVVGQLMTVAQDQNGCRYLQRKFDEGGAAAVEKVFPEVLSNIVELMVDPFGNYLVQKLLDRCSEQQRLEVLKKVAERGELVGVALNTHGTRAVQKLIETLSSREQRAIAIEALRGGVVSLIKDLNGNHVVQRCLQRLGPEDSQFIYDAAVAHCVEVATHRHGCCVLQRCIDFATPGQKSALVAEVAKHALVLSQDAFGNYVVQYVLELGHQETCAAVIEGLRGSFAPLSLQKFSSNVVERCLKLGGMDAEREVVIQELIAPTSLARLLQDGYGNYVIQSALSVTTGSQHAMLVDAIRPYLPTLRGTPHGKRIVQRINGKV